MTNLEKLRYASAGLKLALIATDKDEQAKWRQAISEIKADIAKEE